MRRRSERKKSTDISSPAPPVAAVSRRTRRSRQTSECTSEKGSANETFPAQAEEADKHRSDNANDDFPHEETGNKDAANECGKNTTPPEDQSSPQYCNKRLRSQDDTSDNINSIPEEDTKTLKEIIEEQEEESQQNDENRDSKAENTDNKGEKHQDSDNCKDGVLVENSEAELKAVTSCSSSPKTNVDVLEIQAEENDEEKSQTQETETEANNRESAVEITDEAGDSRSDDKPIEDEKMNSDNNIEMQIDDNITANSVSDEHQEKRSASSRAEEDVVVVDHEDPKHGNEELSDSNTQQRTWVTKRIVENRSPLLVITTETLTPATIKTAETPVTTTTASAATEATWEREEGEKTPSPEKEIPKPQRIHNLISTEKKIITLSEKIRRNQSRNELFSSNTVTSRTTNKLNIKLERRSPSPQSKKATSNVLFITNLVRPFTVMQLKSLLARTGKMVEEDGFWIDRIKSKCYVQYETEDQAIETRHALHGVRWPVSNPKCLIVNFAKKSDLERAIESTKEEQSKKQFGQENQRDNVLIGIGWNRDRNGILDDKRTVRPVREWDVGKKETLEREKTREVQKRRSREREIFFGNRELEQRNGKERRPRSKGRGDARSISRSPVRKIKKKENEPQLRLLDDLFRKTKSTPCIYWLPLTPEQIAEKEAFRQKRLEEHKQRMKQRELEKEKEREKEKEKEKEKERERNRTNDRRDRDRSKDHRRNRSSDRRSRSRDRRRY